MVDTGCTGEMIISQDFAKLMNAQVRQSMVKTAKLADGTAQMSILGETTVSGEF